MSAGLLVEQIAPGASIQDRGRPGYLRYGVTTGGALDLYALAEGQALLHNPANAAALELPGFGGKFRAEGRMTIALSGAEMTARLNDEPIRWRCSLTLRDGDCLEIGALREGVVGYLHVAGGFQTPKILGSRASHLQAGFGCAPMAGDILPVEEQTQDPPLQTLPRPDYFDRKVFHLLKGPQTHVFPSEIFENFLGDSYCFSDKRDRMGARIVPASGPISLEGGLSIASDVINHGDIQIGGDGLPVLLLADRGSSGGYPRIGTVAAADLDAAAQCAAQKTFRLKLLTRPEAVSRWRDHCAAISNLPKRLQPLHRDPRDMADLLSYSLIDGMISAKDFS